MNYVDFHNTNCDVIFMVFDLLSIKTSGWCYHEIV